MKIIPENIVFEQEMISSISSFFKRFSVGSALSNATHINLINIKHFLEYRFFDPSKALRGYARVVPEVLRRE